jgi:hypothetical protein
MLVRLCLVFLVLTGATVGFWALAFPAGFYGAFPGCGRVWISLDGPYNEHLVRDVGGMNLGFATLALFALLRPKLAAPLVVGWATLIFNSAHVIYHATKLGLYQPIDQVAQMFALGSALLASIVLASRVGERS